MLTPRDPRVFSADVLYLGTFGQPSIALGSHEAAVDVLERRSANCSDRPPSPVAEM